MSFRGGSSSLRAMDLMASAFEFPWRMTSRMHLPHAVGKGHGLDCGAPPLVAGVAAVFVAAAALQGRIPPGYEAQIKGHPGGRDELVCAVVADAASRAPRHDADGGGRGLEGLRARLRQAGCSRGGVVGVEEGDDRAAG